MRGFLQIFTHYGGVLLFLFLEGLCFYIIVKFNQKQEQIFIHSSTLIVGNLNDWVDDKGDYFNLTTKIEDLQKENSELYKQLENSFYTRYLEKVDVESLPKDSFLQKFAYIPADIINKSILGSKNFFTLDKGSENGVKAHMGVIGVGGGVIGVVTNVSKHYSTVMTILHRDMSVSASIKRTGYFGSLTWDTKNPMIMNLEYIPRHASVVVGDTVETSGYSNMFPKGSMIGVVEHSQIKSSGDNFEIKVKLKTDLRQVQHAYIVDNLMIEELLTLLKDQ